MTLGIYELRVDGWNSQILEGSPLDFIISGFEYRGFRRYAQSLALVDRESELPPAGLCGTECSPAHESAPVSVCAHLAVG